MFGGDMEDMRWEKLKKILTTMTENDSLEEDDVKFLKSHFDHASSSKTFPTLGIFDELVKSMEWQDYEDGDTIFDLGDPAKWGYQIVDGIMEFFIKNDNNELLISKTAMRGELHGMHKDPSSARETIAKAKGHTKIILVDTQKYLDLSKVINDFLNFHRSEYSQILRQRYNSSSSMFQHSEDLSERSSKT
jgi:CRP-like cAMP-binding protein